MQAWSLLFHLKFKGRQLVKGLLKAEIFPNYLPSSQLESCFYMTVPEKEPIKKKKKEAIFVSQYGFFSL